MKSFLYYLAFFLIVGLGAIGLYSFIVSDPMALLIKIVILAVLIGVGVFLFKRFISPGRGHSTSYKSAVKQSKKRHKSSGHKVRAIRATHLKVVQSPSQKGRRAASFKVKDHAHLTVIEGKKNKKKKRVLF